MLTTVRAFVRDESGAAAVEYGLLITLVSGVAMLSLDSLGVSLSDLFGSADSGLNDAVASESGGESGGGPGGGDDDD